MKTVKFFIVVLALFIPLSLVPCPLPLIPCPFSFAYDQISLPALMAKQFDGRDLRLGMVKEDNQFFTKYSVSYMSGNLKITGIMDVPKGEGPFPVLILCHGFFDPKVYWNGRGLLREQNYFAKRGYVVFHTDYRNYNGSDKDPENDRNLHLGYTEDAINAVLAVKKSTLKFLDKANIGMFGHSLGGGVCLNVMVTKPDLVKAFVLYAPVSADYVKNYQRWIGRDVPKEHKFGTPLTIRQIYGSPESNPVFWQNMSAKNFLQNARVPVIVNQGTKDKSVPPEWANELKKDFEAKGRGGLITLYVYKGESHEFVPQWDLFMERSVKFFDKYLKGR